MHESCVDLYEEQSTQKNRTLQMIDVSFRRMKWQEFRTSSLTHMDSTTGEVSSAVPSMSVLNRIHRRQRKRRLGKSNTCRNTPKGSTNEGLLPLKASSSRVLKLQTTSKLLTAVPSDMLAQSLSFALGDSGVVIVGVGSCGVIPSSLDGLSSVPT